MGAVNWLAVLLATLVAGALSISWPGGGQRGPANEVRSPIGRIAITGALLLLSATMLGHMFARVGAETLEAKPWLYFMMSGGLAIAFVIPALWISFIRLRVPVRAALIDAGHWLATYLAMGLVFFLLG